MCMLASVTIATYTMNYMNTFATHTLGLPPALAFGATVAGGQLRHADRQCCWAAG